MQELTFDEKVGKRIAGLRKKAKLSQQQLTELMGINKRETLSTIEKGKRSLRGDEIVQLANILHTTSDYILTGVNPEYVNINRDFGLSNAAISALHQSIYVKVINCILGNGTGKKFLSDIDMFLYGDFENPTALVEVNKKEWEDRPSKVAGIHKRNNDQMTLSIKFDILLEQHILNRITNSLKQLQTEIKEQEKA